MIKLILENIVKSYGSVEAVRHLSLQINEGELVGILGPSGCGKSTLLSCIAGIEKADSGRIILNDRVLADGEQGIFVPPEKRRMGFVFQDYALWPHMTIGKNLAYPLKIQKIPRQEREREVDRVMELVRLEGKKHRRPHELSGGERQRVALGRALIMNPDLLLLDEPLSNLDARLREEMQLEIRSLQRELGLTVIHVTHDQAEAMAMSDRIILMDKGEIKQKGRPKCLYNNPSTPFAARFMGNNNLIEGQVSLKEGEPVFISEAAPTLSFPCKETKFNGPALCTIRPEDVAMAHCPAEEEECWIVKNRLYKGAHLLYTVQKEGLRLKVQTHTAEDYPLGCPVSLKFRRRLILNLADSPGSLP
ncbi:MAG: ABC transporter ATP-binding protein [Spirochaetales bacterium]|nr:ABC transporter ATP-binding protein [Spirochaetales bacterium]